MKNIKSKNLLLYFVLWQVVSLFVFMTFTFSAISQVNDDILKSLVSSEYQHNHKDKIVIKNFEKKFCDVLYEEKHLESSDAMIYKCNLSYDMVNSNNKYINKNHDFYFYKNNNQWFSLDKKDIESTEPAILKFMSIMMFFNLCLVIYYLISYIKKTKKNV